MGAKKIPVAIRIQTHTRIHPDTGCWEWTGTKQPRGYGKMTMRVDTVRTYSTAHRESYKLHKGDIPDGMLVCHTCDNPSCCNPEHLYLGTNSDNQKDRFQRTKRFNRDENGRLCGA